MDLMPEPELHCTNMSIIRPRQYPSQLHCTFQSGLSQARNAQTVVPLRVGPHLNQFRLRPMVTKLLLCMHASVMDTIINEEPSHHVSSRANGALGGLKASSRE